MKIKLLFVSLFLILLSTWPLEHKQHDVSATTHFPSLHADSPFEAPTIVDSSNINDGQDDIQITITCYSEPPADHDTKTKNLTTENWDNSVTFKVLVIGKPSEADTTITFAKEEDVSIFKHAVTTAERLSGIVNVVDPPYSFTSGSETYSLWLSEHSGSIMNMNDTHTLYILSEDAIEHLLTLIQ